MINHNHFKATTFDNFVNEDAIFEASSLSKTGMPQKMISAIHQKLEHWDKYQRMGHTYRGKAVIPMPFKYHQPAHDIAISEPNIMVGKKTNVDPYSGRSINAKYKDIVWWLVSLPIGENRVLISNPELELFVFIYHKSRSKGATGLQYAIISWDKQNQKAVDFGYSELTTQAVDREEVRKVHDTKGGNRNDKIQEYIRAATRDGGPGYAPSTEKPLYCYKLKVDDTGKGEPRETRKSRTEGTGITTLPVIRLFASKYINILTKLKPGVLDQLKDNIENYGSTNPKVKDVPEEIKELSKVLDVEPGRLFAFLYAQMIRFRTEIFEEGRGRLEQSTSAYAKASGFDLEVELDYVKSTFSWPGSVMSIKIEKKSFAPDKENKPTNSSYRDAEAEKYSRELPISGNIASIQSIIRRHTVDGILSKFAWFILTGKIKFPEASLASLMGVKTDAVQNIDGDKDDANWLY